MKINLLLWIFLLSIRLYGVEKEVEELGVPLSSTWTSGSHLIYDCKQKHWVCVDKDGVELCNKLRGWAKNIDKMSLKCTVIKSFQADSECISAQKRKVEELIPTTFCHASFVDDQHTLE